MAPVVDPHEANRLRGWEVAEEALDRADKAEAERNELEWRNWALERALGEDIIRRERSRGWADLRC
jgi:hypothetical protein